MVSLTRLLSPLTVAVLSGGSQFKLAAHYDGELGITLNGADVSLWADQSGFGNDLIQDTAADQPVYDADDSDFNNLGSLGFDGVEEYMRTLAFAQGALSQPVSVFIVHNTGNPQDTLWLFGALSSSAETAVRYWTSGRYLYNVGTSVVGGTLPTDVTTTINLFVFDGSNSHVYEDGGASELDGDPGPDTPGGITLAASSASTADGFISTKVAEMRWYTGKMTSGDHNTIGNLLATKFGTTWTNI